MGFAIGGEDVRAFEICKKCGKGIWEDEAGVEAKIGRKKDYCLCIKCAKKEKWWTKELTKLVEE